MLIFGRRCSTLLIIIIIHDIMCVKAWTCIVQHPCSKCISSPPLLPLPPIVVGHMCLFHLQCRIITSIGLWSRKHGLCCKVSQQFWRRLHYSNQLWVNFTPNQKLACFVLYLKIINTFLLFFSAFYDKLSKELKNSIKIFSRPSGSWIIDQNNILTVLIHNLKTAWPTKISMPFF